MPCIGNLCPSRINPNGGSRVEQTFESNFCVNNCVNQCVPASVLVHIQSKLSRDKHKGFYLSVTSLLGCLRQLYLERTIDYFVEPPKNWWMLRGSILHHLLENPGIESMIEDLLKEVWRRVEAHPTNQTEVNVILSEALESLNKLAALLPSKEIPNWEAETEYEYDTGLLVSPDGTLYTRDDPALALLDNEAISALTPLWLRGTIDVLRPETGEMYDYKTIGDKGISVIKSGAKPDHIMQFNLYRLLVQRGRPVGKTDYVPVIVNKITAFYMTMMQVVKTGGLMPEVTPWRISEPSNHPSLVGQPELMESVQELRLKKGKRKATATVEDYHLVENKKFKLTYAIPEVPLLDLDEVADFVRTTIPFLHNGFVHNQMPPMCPPAMREWKCASYCPDTVREACDAYNLTTGERRIPEVIDDTIPIESEE